MLPCSWASRGDSYQVYVPESCPPSSLLLSLLFPPRRREKLGSCPAKAAEQTSVSECFSSSQDGTAAPRQPLGTHTKKWSHACRDMGTNGVTEKTERASTRGDHQEPTVTLSTLSPDLISGSHGSQKRQASPNVKFL